MSNLSHTEAYFGILGKVIESKIPGKLFIGAMSWDSNTDSLKIYFSRFGEIADCNAVMDTDHLGKPKCKGFGFVSFKDPEAAEKVVASGEYVLLVLIMKTEIRHARDLF